MTISSTKNKRTFSGDGTTLTFQWDFMVKDADHLQVWIEEGSVYTLQTLDSDYVIDSGLGTTSGEIEFSVAPTSDQKVILLRKLPLLQETEYAEYGPFPANAVENSLDSLIMIVQQLQEESNRAVKVDLIEDSSPDALISTVTAASANAKASANDASNYADDSHGYANAASGYADNALASENDASNYASEAHGYANNASNYASEAHGYANEASTFADNASSSANEVPNALISATYGESISEDDLLYLKSDGKYWKALANASGTMPVRAIATEAGTADQTKTIRLWGEVTAGSGMTTGDNVWVSANTSGSITTTQPAASGEQVQLVGIALSSNEILFDPSMVVVEVE